MVYAHASCDETMTHLNFLKDIHKFGDNDFLSLLADYEQLSRKLSKFIQYIEKEWK
jgi:four helix bundle protein